jgi:hypothetical protein
VLEEKLQLSWPITNEIHKSHLIKGTVYWGQKNKIAKHIIGTPSCKGCKIDESDVQLSNLHAIAKVNYNNTFAPGIINTPFLTELKRSIYGLHCCSWYFKEGMSN